MINYPLISIITPSFNQASYLEQTILSIINQNYPKLEYVIIDGGSTDGSVEIIKKYQSHLKYWISEPDKGQADAINKGLAYCNGEIFNWINSDDLLPPNALNVIASLYQKNTTIAGRVYNFYENNPALNDYTQNNNLNFLDYLCLKSTYHQPGIWINLEAIQSIKLDITSHYYFDFMFYLEYFKKKPDIIYTDQIIANFRVHDQSKTSLIHSKSQLELINHYKKIYRSEDYKSVKKNIEKVIKYLEASRLLGNWLKRDLNKRSTISLFCLIFSNIKYVEINVFWKFAIKYLINYKNIRYQKYH